MYAPFPFCKLIRSFCTAQKLGEKRRKEYLKYIITYQIRIEKYFFAFFWIFLYTFLRSTTVYAGIGKRVKRERLRHS